MRATVTQLDASSQHPKSQRHPDQPRDQVGAVGGKDPARCLVLMLKSRRLHKHNVEETITFMGNDMPSRRQIDNAEAGGEPLDPQHKLCRIVLPVLSWPTSRVSSAGAPTASS